MNELVIAFLGDVVGAPGRRAFTAAAKHLRDARNAHLILVNGENAKHGSGLHPDGYRDLRRAGADAVSLGDHWMRDSAIFPLLESDSEPIARPANLAAAAKGKRYSVISDPAGARPNVYLITVLGRIFMPIPANDPFAAIDELVSSIESRDPDAVVIIEVHSEATSEKIAITWHCTRRWTGRIVAVVGTHTHVQTADARITDGPIAAITDLGMCGGHRGVIGRQIDPVLTFMTTQNPAVFDVAHQDIAANGCIFRIDPVRRRALAIEPFSMRIPD